MLSLPPSLPPPHPCIQTALTHFRDFFPLSHPPSITPNPLPSIFPQVLRILRVLRALRALRALRFIARQQSLRIVAATLLSSARPITVTSSIVAAFFLILALTGIQLFSGKFWRCTDLTRTTSEVCTGATLDGDRRLWYNRQVRNHPAPLANPQI